MKKLSFFSVIIILLIFSIAQFGFKNISTDEALEGVKDHFHNELQNLKENIQSYHLAATNFNNSQNSIEELKTIHLQTRSSFKKIEFLLEYFDRLSVKKYLNGAPLPTIEPNVPEIVKIDPTGLQVLDELVFSEETFENKEEIIQHTHKLESNFKKVYHYQVRLKLQHRFVFEAIRQELVRVFTLGVTGFDTPGSVNALPEARTSFQGIMLAFNSYIPLLSNRNSELAQEIPELLQGAIQYLEKNNDFDSFDRLDFLKTYINPLYKKFFEAHQTLQIETISEVSERAQATNYQATGIFDNDFLNPSYFSNTNLEQAQSEKRKELGRLLFFDPILSSNIERACSSCHDPNKAFTDGLKTSLAIKGNVHIQRNSPTLINSIYADKYFYDLREPNLERQIKHVILDSLEFATDFFEIIKKLEQSEGYQTMFAEAYVDYPDYTISKWSISDALANYISSLTSFDSPFDQYVRDERTDLSEAAKRGFNLFMGKAACGTCHFAPTFNGSVPPIYDESESEILGVPVKADTINLQLDYDLGRIASSQPQDVAPFYAHSFKTVTVRNIAHTAPYFHNGAYQTLEEVLDFYNRGGGAGMGLDLPYQTLPDSPLNLSQNEMNDIITFMETLTDFENHNNTPTQLPEFKNHPEWNKRKIGGVY